MSGEKRGERRRGWYDAERSGERAKSSERRRKHASLAGTHVETSSAAGLAGALSGVFSVWRIGERSVGRTRNDWQSAVSSQGERAPARTRICISVYM